MLCLPVLNAPGAPRSLENRGLAPLVQQKYKLVSVERCRLLPPSSLLPAPCPAPSFFFSFDGAESIGTLVQVGPRSSYSSSSLSRRKIYVNRHVDTCLNVAGARARAERDEVRGREKGLEVGLLVCSVGFRGVSGRAKGEKRTPRDAVARRRVHTHTRARHARSACRPSHESKLFVTGGKGQKEGGHTCLLTISGRSCRGSYRVLLIREIWI